MEATEQRGAVLTPPVAPPKRKTGRKLAELRRIARTLIALERGQGTVDQLKADLAVQASHVRRLLGEKQWLLERATKLLAQKRELAATITRLQAENRNLAEQLGAREQA